jgi:BNR/Asp-box repeat
MARTLLAAAAAGLALVHGTPNADRITTANGKRDTVTCGAGRDILVADAFDQIQRDCETLSLRISVDSAKGPGQHLTEVEPSAFGFGSTVVSTFQVARFEDGGAEATGFATSRDAGRSWRSGLLPGLTTGGGPWTRVSDPVVTYDATHRVWLAATLALAPARNGVAVNRSPDGLAWSPAVTVVDSANPLAFDKEWIVCDNWPSSPRRGTCYLQWTDVAKDGIASQTSVDGGQTWSPPVVATTTGFGTQPVVLPDGTLVTVVLADSQRAVLAARSTDGGATFSALAQFTDVQFANPAGLRAPPLPSVAVDASGRIATVWPDCRFRPTCTANDIVLATSTDGATWSPPARVALAPAGTTALVPGLGAGAAGRFALTYYTAGAALVGVRTIQTADGGTTWSPPRRLDVTPAEDIWLAETEGGRFVGDYIATAFVAGRPMPVFSLAVANRRQSIFATTSLR